MRTPLFAAMIALAALSAPAQAQVNFNVDDPVSQFHALRNADLLAAIPPVKGEPVLKKDGGQPGADLEVNEANGKRMAAIMAHIQAGLPADRKDVEWAKKFLAAWVKIKMAGINDPQELDKAFQMLKAQHPRATDREINIALTIVIAEESYQVARRAADTEKLLDKALDAPGGIPPAARGDFGGVPENVARLAAVWKRIASGEAIEQSEIDWAKKYVAERGAASLERLDDPKVQANLKEQMLSKLVKKERLDDALKATLQVLREEMLKKTYDALDRLNQAKIKD